VTRDPRVIFEFVARVLMSHVTYGNESCHVWERVMSHKHIKDSTVTRDPRPESHVFVAGVLMSHVT